MAAQERKTNDRTTTAGAVGAVAVVAMVAVAVAAPVTAVAAAVVTATVATVTVGALRRRDTVEVPSVTETRDNPERPCPEPAACD